MIYDIIIMYKIFYCLECWESLSNTMKKIQKEECKKYNLYCIHEHDKLKEKYKQKKKKIINYDYLSNMNKYKK
jgi:TRAP-type C4-dicarboxylate transport system substrate-binding protein